MRTDYQQHQIALFAVMVLALIPASQTLGVSYTAIDLNPFSISIIDVIANGANGMQQVGSGRLYSWDDVQVYRAVLWSGSADSLVNLHPSGYYESGANGISGTQQVGWGRSAPLMGESALLWNGTADSCVDLHPTGFVRSFAYDTNGTQQVGQADVYNMETYQFIPRAILWNGSADSYVNLQPSGFTSSVAYGISGTQQVGQGDGHALLWNGSADSYVDLNPSGFGSSIAYDISGTQQVGAAGSHAVLWNGTADSCIDLQPVGFLWSFAEGTNGTRQVGTGRVPGKTHALLWNGSGDSYIDLNQFLPAGFSSAGATDIDEHGNIVGWAMDDFFQNHPILWQPVPDPAIPSLFAFCEQWLAFSDQAPCPLSADLAGNDCYVNLKDFAILAAEWLQQLLE